MNDGIGVLLVAASAIGGGLVGLFLNALVVVIPDGRRVVFINGGIRHALREAPRQAGILALSNAGIWSAAMLWAFIDPDVLPLVPTLWVLSSACLALWLIDIRHHRLPNAIVYPLYPLVAATLVLAGITSGEWHVGRVLGSVAIWLAVFIAISLASRGHGMGLGDVKFAPLLAAVLGWFGWGASVCGLIAAFVVGGVVSLLLLLSGRGRHTAIPFGPFMITGAAIGIACGTAAADWYFSVG